MLIAELIQADLPRLSSQATLRAAGTLMREAGADALVVEEHGRPAGIVTAYDLAHEGCGFGLDPSTAPVEVLMRRDPLCCAPDMDLAQARTLMREQGADALAVCDQGGTILGVVPLVTLLDLLAGPPSAQSRGPEPEQVERVRGNTF